MSFLDLPPPAVNMFAAFLLHSAAFAEHLQALSIKCFVPRYLAQKGRQLFLFFFNFLVVSGAYHCDMLLVVCCCFF